MTFTPQPYMRSTLKASVAKAKRLFKAYEALPRESRQWVLADMLRKGDRGVPEHTLLARSMRAETIRRAGADRVLDRIRALVSTGKVPMSQVTENYRGLVDDLEA
jgi:hypothetical protein